MMFGGYWSVTDPHVLAAEIMALAEPERTDTLVRLLAAYQRSVAFLARDVAAGYVRAAPEGPRLEKPKRKGGLDLET